MDIAVEAIKGKSFHCFYFFLTQISFFFASCFMLMWILYNPIVALTANGILAITLFIFLTNGAELFDLLYISDDEAIDHNFGDSPTKTLE